MCHQAQNGFHGIFIEIPQHQKCYLVYVPHKQNILSSYDVFMIFFCCVGVHITTIFKGSGYTTSCVIHILWYIYIIIFTQFEEGSLLSENRNNTESGNKSDDNSTLAPLISEEEMDVMASGDGFDSELISTEILEDIYDGIQSHTSINSREAP